MNDLDQLKSFGEGLGTLTPRQRSAIRGRVEGMIEDPSHPRMTKARPSSLIVAAIAASIALTLVAGGIVLSRGEGSDQIRSEPAAGTPTPRDAVATSSDDGGLVPGANPYPEGSLLDPIFPLLSGGQQVSIDEAAALADHAVYITPMLQDPEAWAVEYSDESGVRYDVGLRYGSTLAVLFATFDEGQDPAEVYRAESTDWGVGYLDTVNGNPVWVVPRAENSLDASTSVLHIAIGDTDVELHGHMSAQELVDVAASLRPFSE
jgi:hypothetical protein